MCNFRGILFPVLCDTEDLASPLPPNIARTFNHAVLFWEPLPLDKYLHCILKNKLYWRNEVKSNTVSYVPIILYSSYFFPAAFVIIWILPTYFTPTVIPIMNRCFKFFSPFVSIVVMCGLIFFHWKGINMTNYFLNLRIMKILKQTDTDRASDFSTIFLILVIF